MEPDSLVRRITEEFGVPANFEPTAYYDRDGDCVEFLLSNEPFRAERLDKWVTVYIGQETGELVGSLIKNVRSELLKRFPGVMVYVQEGRVRIEHLLLAPGYQEGDPIRGRQYANLIGKAKGAEVETELPALC